MEGSRELVVPALELSQGKDRTLYSFAALLNGWEVVLSWRDEANTASLQSSFQETHHHQEIPTSDT